MESLSIHHTYDNARLLVSNAVTGVPPVTSGFPACAPVYYFSYLNFTRPHVARNDTLFNTRTNRRADHHISIVLDDFTLARVGHAGTGDDILTYTAIVTAICIRYIRRTASLASGARFTTLTLYIYTSSRRENRTHSRFEMVPAG